jgi:hypothetical protein
VLAKKDILNRSGSHLFGAPGPCQARIIRPNVPVFVVISRGSSASSYYAGA